MMDPKHYPRAKVAAGTTAGAVGVLLVAIWDGLTGYQVDASQAAVLITAVTSIAAYAMPDVPPWKR